MPVKATSRSPTTSPWRPRPAGSSGSCPPAWPTAAATWSCTADFGLSNLYGQKLRELRVHGPRGRRLDLRRHPLRHALRLPALRWRLISTCAEEQLINNAEKCAHRSFLPTRSPLAHGDLPLTAFVTVTANII